MISEELERYISQVLSYASLIDSELAHLRLAVIGVLQDLATIALNPIPGPSLTRMASELRSDITHRPISMTMQLHGQPEMQMVTRYLKTVASEIEAMLLRCGESV